MVPICVGLDSWSAYGSAFQAKYRDQLVFRTHLGTGTAGEVIHKSCDWFKNHTIDESEACNIEVLIGTRRL
jgi:hypothetical protein